MPCGISADSQGGPDNEASRPNPPELRKPVRVPILMSRFWCKEELAKTGGRVERNGYEDLSLT